MPRVSLSSNSSRNLASSSSNSNHHLMNCSLNAAEKVSAASKSSKAFGKASKGSGKAEKVASEETHASAKAEKMSYPGPTTASAKASKPDDKPDAGWGGGRARV